MEAQSQGPEAEGNLFYRRPPLNQTAEPQSTNFARTADERGARSIASVVDAASDAFAANPGRAMAPKSAFGAQPTGKAEKKVQLAPSAF